MSAEFPSGNETPKQAPKPEGTGADRPGYPPPGQQAALAKIKAAEAAEGNNLEAILSELESQETEAVRVERLKAFVAEHFPDCPAALHGAAAKACQSYEDENREFFGEPDLKISNEDVGELKPEIDRLAVVADNDETISDNNGTISEVKTQVETAKQTVESQEVQKDASVVEIKRETAKTPALQERKIAAKRQEANAEAKNEGVTADEKLVKENYPEPLKSEHGGSIGALKALRRMVSQPESKNRIDRVLNTITALQNAVPGKAEVITRMINASHVDLSAGSPVQIFAGFLAEADKSPDLTEDEKAQIRQVLHKQADIKSGSDIAKVLKDGRGVKTTTDESGNVVTETIDYDKDNPAELGPGQSLYLDNGSPILRLKVDSGKVLEFNLPEGSEADMGKVAIMGQTMDTLADMNLDGPIYQRGLTLEAGGRIDLNFPKDWVTTQRVLKIFFDRGTGWDNRLLTKQDTAQMKFLLQGNSVKGDATRADRNADSATSDLAGQGILDKNGDIDWARFEQVVAHNRDQLGKGQIDYDNVPAQAA